MEKNSPYFMVQSVERALKIIDFFIRENKPLGIPEIARELKLHNSVVHRLLATLKAYDFLEQLPDTAKYRVGPKAFEFGSVYMNNQLFIEGRRYLPALTEETGELSHLAVLNQGTLLYVIKQGLPKSLLVSVPVSMRNPINTTALGKTMLAWMDKRKAVEILQIKGMQALTPNSICDIDTFVEGLKEVREKGYAVDHEETRLGHRCIAAPIRDFTGEVIAGISVSGTVRSITGERVEPVADILKKYAAAISEKLGHIPRNYFS